MNSDTLNISRPARRHVALVVALGALGTVATIGQMISLGIAVNRVFLDHSSLRDVGLLLIILALCILVRSGLAWLREMIAARGASVAMSQLRLELFDRLLALGPAYGRGERSGELVAIASDGIERLEPYLSKYLPQTVLSVLTPLIIVAFVFTQDWISGVLLLVTAPVIPMMMVLVGSYTERHTRHQWLALARMSAQLLDSLQGLPLVRTFGREREERMRVSRVSEDFRVRTLGVLKLAFLSGLVLEFMTTIAIALIAVTLGTRLLSGSISFQSSFLVLLLTPEFFRPLRELGVQRHAAMEGRAAAESIFEVLRKQPIGITADSARSSTPAKSDVELRNIAFTYPGSAEPAVRNVSFTLASGSQIALIGKSGSGKSTLVNLLMRFDEPDVGQILLNDRPITEMIPAAWRRYTALVPQRPHLFYGSLLENIRMGRPEATDAEVREAADLAYATEFIEDLPNGYDTQLGENAAGLSAGQAQRIAVARAFLKDAPFVILDEPTSALDPGSEMAIRSAIKRLAVNRTVLVVAHRLSTVRSADQVIVMDDGEVRDTGTCDELLSRGCLVGMLSHDAEVLGV